MKREKEKGRAEEKQQTRGEEEEKTTQNAETAGRRRAASLDGGSQKKTQTLVPINELHKLQLKPWALI